MKFFPVLFVACACVKGVLSSEGSNKRSIWASSSSHPTIPDDVLQELRTLLHSDALEISPLDARWREMLEPLKMQERVAQWASCQNLLGLGYTKELIQLYILAHCLWVLPEQMFDCCYSGHIPQSSITVEWAVKNIQKFNSSTRDQYSCFRKLITNLVEHEYFELLAHLLKRISSIIPDIFDWECVCQYTYRVGEIFPDILLQLMRKNGIASSRRIFSTILFAPVSDKTGAMKLANLLRSIKGYSNGNVHIIEYALTSICLSCELELEAHSADACALIHERNTELIAWLESSVTPSSIRISALCSYTRLLNEIRFGSVNAGIQEEDIRSSILSMLGARIQCSDFIQSGWISNTNISEDFIFLCNLMLVSVRAQKLELFQKMINMIESTQFFNHTAKKEMRRFLERHSDFTKRLSVDCCKKLLEMKCASFEVIHILQREDCNDMVMENMHNIYRVVRFAVAVTIGVEYFDAVASEMFTTHSKDIRRFLQVLIDKFENPLPLLARSLSHITPSQRLSSNFDIARVFGNEKCLRALLQAEHDDPIFNVLSEFRIPLSIDVVKTLLKDSEFANAFKSRQGEFILQHLYFSLVDLIYYNDLRFEQVLRLFEILRVPIHDRSFSFRNVDYNSRSSGDEGLFQNDSALKDIIKCAHDPGFLANLTLSVYSKDCRCKSVKENMLSDRPNLFRLRSRDMLEELFRNNKVSFQRFGPPAVVRVFCPLPTKTVEEAIRRACIHWGHRNINIFELFKLYPEAAKLAISSSPVTSMEREAFIVDMTRFSSNYYNDCGIW